MSTLPTSPKPAGSEFNVEDDPFDVVDEVGSGFAIIHHDIIDRFGKAIGVYGAAVYMALKRFANAAESGACKPSYGTIAERLGMSRRQAIRTVQRLEEVGLVHSLPRAYVTENGRSRRLSNTYRLRNPLRVPTPTETSQSLVTVSHHPSSDCESPTLVTVSHSNDKKQKRTTHTHTSAPARVECVEESEKTSGVTDVAIAVAIARVSFDTDLEGVPIEWTSKVIVVATECEARGITAAEVLDAGAAFAARRRGERLYPTQVVTEVLRFRAKRADEAAAPSKPVKAPKKATGPVVSAPAELPPADLPPWLEGDGHA